MTFEILGEIAICLRFETSFSAFICLGRAKSGLFCAFRSTSSFKLKHRVRVSEIWLATCLDDVCETTKASDRSFVIGWPTTNFVASFK